MNIGLDIDGVLIDDDTYRLDTMSKYCFENNLPNLDKPYEYENKCNWTEETINDYRNKFFYEYLRNAPVRNYSVEVIKRLHDEKNRIIIITGRYKCTENSEIGEKIRKDTIYWLNKNNILYDEICFTKCPKIKAIQQKNIDLMIEDSPEIIPQIVKYTKVLCYDNRYNVNLQYDNMVRVFSWYDIYRKIKNITI